MGSVTVEIVGGGISWSVWVVPGEFGGIVSVVVSSDHAVGVSGSSVDDSDGGSGSISGWPGFWGSDCADSPF